MSAPLVKGWCPTALTPMESGDGYLVRVKPRAATLSAEQVDEIAKAAGEFGNGLVDLTNRGNLQIRGLTESSLGPFQDWILSSGLASADPATEAARNVLADPLGKTDPAARFDSHRLALSFTAMIEETPAFANLPDKFGIAIDAGGILPLDGVLADVTFRATNEGLLLELAGGGRCRVPLTEAKHACARLISAFLDWRNEEPGDDQSHSRRRMAQMVGACGTSIVFDKAGISATAASEPRSGRGEPRPHLGYHPFDIGQAGFVGVGAPFGLFDAEDLAVLASLAKRHGDGTVRMTPWKTVLLADVDKGSALDIQETAAGRNWIVDDQDTRRRIVTCAGAPRCNAANADTRADAARLAPFLSAELGRLHVSGCAKGCAHPRVADATVVATVGGYDLIRNGTASDDPDHRGMSAASLADYFAHAGRDKVAASGRVAG